MDLYTLVQRMAGATKTVRVSEDLLTRIKAHNREGKTLNETLDRLIRGPSLRELTGILSNEETVAFREAIEASHDSHSADITEMLEDME